MELKTFPRYKTYKDSGIEWIGEIPAHWVMKRIKDIIEVIMGQSPSSKSYNKVGEGLPFFQGSADFGNFYPIERVWCTDPKKIALENDIFISVRAPVGDKNLCNKESCIGRGLTILRSKNINFRFTYYFADVLKTELKKLSTGSTFYAIGNDTIKAINIIFPPSSEQTAIADFLDDKITKIDRLIQNKETQIERLKELRQITITRAVTKGLNPDAPMKDSGIEWLGEIPAYWEVKRMKEFIKPDKLAIKTGPFGSDLKSIDFVDSGFKVYNQKNVIEDDFTIGDDFIDEIKYKHLETCRLYSDDVVLTSRGTIGKCSIFPDNAEIGIMHPCLIRIQVNPKLCLPDFLRAVISDSSYLAEQLLYISNATTIEVIYSDNLRKMTIALPPISEQDEILGYLNDQTSKIDWLISNEENQIERFKEYRKIVIHNAVTGKWKVSSLRYEIQGSYFNIDEVQS